MREPIGACEYCGQEFMRRQSLANHEERCLGKPSSVRCAPIFDQPEQEEEKNVRAVSQEPQTRSRALTGIGSGVQVWRRSHG